MTNKNQTKLWQEHFSKGNYDERYPSEQVIRFLMRYKKRTGLTGKVLDLGCGVGRHLLMAVENGFSGYGMDIVDSALRKTRKNLAARGYHASLIKGSLTKLPYANNFFDIVISYSVFDHVKFADAIQGINEVKRVLKSGGLIYFKLETSNSPEMKLGRVIGKNTRILKSNCEKDILQHYFSLSEVHSLFKDFKILVLEKEEIKDLIKSRLTLSRWHIIAQKPS
jgi:ubiquinone/menaquinone biosynthesis C-methylase UbiE